LGVAAAALCILAVCSTQAADRKRGRSIEFSAPRGDEVSTNLNQLTSKKDSLKQLEADLYSPLRSFSPKSSLDGVVAPLPQRPNPPVVQSKQAKDLLERRKNWIFMRPEDLIGEPTVESVLKAPQYGKDGQEKKDLRPLELYYQRLNAKQTPVKRPGQSKDEDIFGSNRKQNPANEAGMRDDSALPDGIAESADKLKSVFEAEKSSNLAPRGGVRSSFSNPFGLAVTTQSKEQVAEQKKFMDDYRSLFDHDSHPPAGANSANPSTSLAATASPARSPSASLASPASPAPHHGLQAQNDVLNPLLGPAGLPNVNGRAVGQSRPAFPTPTVQAPKAIPFTYAAPKRAF